MAISSAYASISSIGISSASRINKVSRLQYQIEEQEIQGKNSDLEPLEVLIVNNESSDERDDKITLDIAFGQESFCKKVFIHNFICIFDAIFS